MCLCWRKAAPLDSVGQLPALPTLSTVQPGFSSIPQYVLLQRAVGLQVPYEQIKQIGKRHMKPVYLRTSQSGSKGDSPGNGPE